MKFKDFLIKEGVTASIDDNDVLQTLDGAGIAYTRTKDDNGSLLYSFDNRYSLKYDGSVFTLYRSENRIHYANARNKSEIETAISNWASSYALDTTEVTDDDVENIVDQMKKDAAEKEGSETDGSEDVAAKKEDTSSEKEDTNNDADFYSTIDTKKEDK